MMEGEGRRSGPEQGVPRRMTPKDGRRPWQNHLDRDSRAAETRLIDAIKMKCWPGEEGAFHQALEDVLVPRLGKHLFSPFRA